VARRHFEQTAVANDLSLELGKLLDQYDENRRAVEERRRQVKTDEENFQKGFSDLRTGVVRPVLESIGGMLKARGHDFSISEEEYAAEHGGKITEAAISFHVMPAGMEKSTHLNAQFPSLSFVTRHYNRTVCILASNAVPKPSGAAGSRGDYQLAQVDTELVQAEVLKLIAGIVRTL
jgi:hypothetical protein